MAKKPTIIEINGRKYDADSGEMITSGSVNHVSKSDSGPSVSAQRIDGFAAPHRVRNKQPAGNVHKKNQKSQKLHPLAAQAAKRRQIKKTAPVRKTADLKPTEPAKRALSQSVKAERVKRAKNHAKSEKISKFTSASEENASPAPQADRQPQPQTPPPAVKSARREQPAEDSGEDKQNWLKRLHLARPKLLPTAASVAVALTLVGYVTYLNLPNMALRVAASRAGFEASLPGYKPSGFKLDGPISYAPGQIAVKFAAAADDRQFELIQRESTWDSQSLLDNFVVRENKQYVTFQESGLTIYVYDDSNATWVNNGIWYTVEGDSLLSSEQLLKIATSL